MKKQRLARWAVSAALFYFTLGATCQGIQAQSETGFRLVHDTLVIVSLRVNDQGPFDFVLDTGADTTIRLFSGTRNRRILDDVHGCQARTEAARHDFACDAALYVSLILLRACEKAFPSEAWRKLCLDPDKRGYRKFGILGPRWKRSLDWMFDLG